ncbi:MAG TPA: hypothetical protein VNA88_16595 [Candidatus Kapabacteria bacterium]|nr:hypothetical protein [Candidatus Kapabacteria bacterium]
MPRDLIPSVLRRCLSFVVLAFVVLVWAEPALAQRPFGDFRRADSAAQAVVAFISASATKGIDSVYLYEHAVGRFVEKMLPLAGQKPFPPHLRYEVTAVQSIRDDDSLAMVALTSVVDTLGGFGPLAVEMTFFVQLDEKGWRIADMRRFKHIETRAHEIRAIDTSSDYPRALKPRMVRELSSVLLSNEQLRENFHRNRAGFADLAARFSGRDSLRILGRTDRSIVQLNRLGIEWGVAAHEIPKEAIDEYLASASPKDRAALRTELKHAERMRRIGRDSLAKHARRYGLSVAHLDSTVALMADLRVSFVNAQLPWKGAVQMTVGGVIDDAIGYLYSPNGEIPIVSNDEFYYLEQIADDWWIFRAG